MTDYGPLFRALLDQADKRDHVSRAPATYLTVGDATLGMRIERDIVLRIPLFYARSANANKLLIEWIETCLLSRVVPQ